MEVEMAKARMLHKKISVSAQVNKLSLPAKLLFTWMIAHADDEGRLKGDSPSVKATVIPMATWSFKRVKVYLDEIKSHGLVHFWEENGDWFIEFTKWSEHQQIRKDRFEPSKLPSFNKDQDNQTVDKSQPDDNQETSQSNISESSEVEFNIGEYKEEAAEEIADKNSYRDRNIGFKRVGDITNPDNYPISNEREEAAHFAYKALEPDNPASFRTTYLWAVNRGVPASIIRQFVSEIQQDPSIRNKGAIFRTKVEGYLGEHQR